MSSREHTYRLQPNGDDTERSARDATASPAFRSWPATAASRSCRSATSSNLGHASWVVSERFSNTAQFSDNLTKVYKSHAFKGGYMYQNIFFGSTQPPYARGEYSWNGSYTSLVNVWIPAPDGRICCSTRFRRWCREASISPAARTCSARRRSASVDAFKTYHGATCRTAGTRRPSCR